jgi:hypothetical protein
MPGASEETRRVKILNANWTPDAAGDDGRFELLIVTEDDQRYVLPASPGSMTALVALAPPALRGEPATAPGRRVDAAGQGW